MKIAIAQILSGGNPAENLETVQEYTERAASQGAELVVFPEATMCAFGHPLSEIAEPLDGPWANGVRRAAEDAGVVVVVGMFTPGTGGRVRNTLLACGPGVDTHYNKIHLFDAFGYSESDSVDPGDAPVVFDVGGATVGLATCYDVRFPALFAANANAGAHINIVCASWGAGDGKAEQWDLLIRARAVDSTTFVLAVDQADPASMGRTAAGTAPTGIGRSALVSPLGAVIQGLDGQAGLIVVDVDPGRVDEARAKLPVLANARDLGAPARC